MKSEQTIEKQKLIERIAKITIGTWYDWTPPSVPPILGEKYVAQLELANKKSSQILQELDVFLVCKDVQLLEMYFELNEDNKPKEFLKALGDSRQSAVEFIKKQSHFIKAGLGDPDLVANYDHWSKVDSIFLTETILLSVGVEPVQYLRDLFKGPLDTGHNTLTDPVFKVLRRRFELFKRKFSGIAKDPIIKGVQVLDWINSIELEVHPGFRQMLEIIVSRGSQKETQPELMNSVEKPLEARELASISKMIAAMAIDAYGYDPAQKRGPIPNEIQNISDRLGLSISADTIRKYLQMGASHLPSDWKPEK